MIARALADLGGAPGFRSAAAKCAAQNFTMPAMSPTMTEGNIAAWKVKEGDSFSTGDVLLEIETDKAQMDVEAQDDGVVAKITQPDGTKSVQVGSRIAILAEPDDDLSTLSLPAEKAAPSKTSPSSADAAPPSKPSPPPSDASPSTSTAAKAKKQTYPLYPSVEHLLHVHGLNLSEADKIPASGPSGRLLKGDVLAYLGDIPSSYPAELSARVSKLEHLDLSNIKLAPPTKSEIPTPSTKPAAAPEPEPEAETATEIAVLISLSSVLAVQKRIQETLGVVLPLSTFIARATELANDDLPRSKTQQPSLDELYQQVLGLDTIAGNETARGHFIPQIVALSSPTPSTPALSPSSPKAKLARSTDIYDILSTSTRQGKTSPRLPALREGIAAGTHNARNVFSVTAPRGEEERARLFLERVKVLLEAEPGRLVL
ncbi:MAG: pyridoxine biosynthesis protein [Thelocarpon superellum]|nr:MAG: pyridoxine biosynthesis protein [Thelocarpon superellum]